jgi:putative glycosyltransferase
MIMMMLSLGILTTAMGIVGIYLGKVFNQVQNWPNYIVRNAYRQEEIWKKPEMG